MPRYEDTAPALAEAATQGRWAIHRCFRTRSDAVAVDDQAEADATLIAAHSPDVVRALAEVVGAARALLAVDGDDLYEALAAALARLDAATGGGR